jgi:hypothetical protein
VLQLASEHAVTNRARGCFKALFVITRHDDSLDRQLDVEIRGDALAVRGPICGGGMELVIDMNRSEAPIGMRRSQLRQRGQQDRGIETAAEGHAEASRKRARKLRGQCGIECLERKRRHRVMPLIEPRLVMLGRSMLRPYDSDSGCD